MFSLWQKAQATVSAVADNFSNVLEQLDNEISDTLLLTDEERVQLELQEAKKELEITKKLLDEAQLQHVEMAKQTRLMLAEKDAEVKSLQLNSGIVSPPKSDQYLQNSVLMAEKQALLEHIHHVEEKLRSVLGESNDYKITLTKYEDLLRKYRVLEASDNQKADSIDSLVSEYSRLSAEFELRQNMDQERLAKVLQENEVAHSLTYSLTHLTTYSLTQVLAIKMQHMEHNIVEIADRVSTQNTDDSGPASGSVSNQELKEIRAKVVTLQYDLKEKDREIGQLQQKYAALAAAAPSSPVRPKDAKAGTHCHSPTYSLT